MLRERKKQEIWQGTDNTGGVKDLWKSEEVFRGVSTPGRPCGVVGEECGQVYSLPPPPLPHVPWCTYRQAGHEERGGRVQDVKLCTCFTSKRTLAREEKTEAVKQWQGVKHNCVGVTKDGELKRKQLIMMLCRLSLRVSVCMSEHLCDCILIYLYMWHENTNKGNFYEHITKSLIRPDQFRQPDSQTDRAGVKGTAGATERGRGAACLHWRMPGWCVLTLASRRSAPPPLRLAYVMERPHCVWKWGPSPSPLSPPRLGVSRILILILITLVLVNSRRWVSVFIKKVKKKKIVCP